MKLISSAKIQLNYAVMWHNENTPLLFNLSNQPIMITLRDIERAIDDIQEHNETDVFAHRDEIDYLLMPEIVPQTIATVRQMDKDILVLSCEEFMAKYAIKNIHSSQPKRCGGVRDVTLIDSILNIYYLSLAISIERKYGKRLYRHRTKGLFAEVFQNRNGYARYADDCFLFMPLGKDPIELLKLIEINIQKIGLSINQQKLKAYAIDLKYLFHLPAMDISEELDDKTEKYKNN